MRRVTVTGINFAVFYVNPVLLLFGLALLCIAMLQASPCLHQSVDKTNFISQQANSYRRGCLPTYLHALWQAYTEGVSPNFCWTSYWLAYRPVIIPTMTDDFSMWCQRGCLLLMSCITVIHLCCHCQDTPMPTAMPTHRKRRKRRKPALNTGFSQFRRRKLPYHLVMRCRRRKGNRPIRVFGPSRAELLRVRREKRRRYRYNRALRRPLQAWVEATSGQQAPCFRLYEPDDDCLNRLVRTIGPGGTPLNAECGAQLNFELETSTPRSIIDTTPLSTQE